MKGPAIFLAQFAGFGDGVDESDEVAADLLAEVVVLGGPGRVGFAVAGGDHARGSRSHPRRLSPL